MCFSSFLITFPHIFFQLVLTDLCFSYSGMSKCSLFLCISTKSSFCGPDYFVSQVRYRKGFEMLQNWNGLLLRIKLKRSMCINSRVGSTQIRRLFRYLSIDIYLYMKNEINRWDKDNKREKEYWYIQLINTLKWSVFKRMQL